MKRIKEREAIQLLGYMNQYRECAGSHLTHTERLLGVIAILLSRIDKKLDEK